MPEASFCVRAQARLKMPPGSKVMRALCLPSSVSKRMRTLPFSRQYISSRCSPEMLMKVPARLTRRVPSRRISRHTGEFSSVSPCTTGTAKGVNPGRGVEGKKGGIWSVMEGTACRRALFRRRSEEACPGVFGNSTRVKESRQEVRRRPPSAGAERGPWGCRGTTRPECSGP